MRSIFSRRRRQRVCGVTDQCRERMGSFARESLPFRLQQRHNKVDWKKKKPSTQVFCVAPTGSLFTASGPFFCSDKNVSS
jgi:hypothetical protein